MAAEANGVIEEAEQKLLESYADEMDIKLDDASNLSFEENLKELKKISNTKEINQMAFEIIGMVMSDMEYDDDEKNYIEKVASSLEIEMNKIDEMFKCVNAYVELVKKINILMYS